MRFTFHNSDVTKPMSNNKKDIDDIPIPSNGVEKDRNGYLNNDKEINILQFFSSLFFGVLTQFDDRYNVSSTSNTVMPTQERTNSLTESSPNIGQITESVDRLDDLPSNEHDIDGVLDQIEKVFPFDPIKLRQTSLYKGTLQMLQWQRDNYLVGNEYADWRKNDRLRQRQQEKYYTFRATLVDNYNIPYNEATISHQQISSLASKFIPTATVQNLLTPIVNGLFVKETGVLFDPIKQSTIQLIIAQQKNLEQSMKTQLLQLLDNPRNRDAIKDSTQGIIIQTAKIDDHINQGRTSK